MDTQSIRKNMREQRKQLSPEQVTHASRTITEKIIHLPAFLSANHIGFYCAQENEIDCRELITTAFTLKKSVYLPRLSEEKKLAFYPITDKTPFKKNKWGIEEPDCAIPISLSQLEVLIIPIVAFDHANHRIGRGAGYYDRYLQPIKDKPSAQRTVLIGLAYGFQRIERIMPNPWDVSMDQVITEE